MICAMSCTANAQLKVTKPQHTKAPARLTTPRSPELTLAAALWSVCFKSWSPRAGAVAPRRDTRVRMRVRARRVSRHWRLAIAACGPASLALSTRAAAEHLDGTGGILVPAHFPRSRRRETFTMAWSTPLQTSRTPPSCRGSRSGSPRRKYLRVERGREKFRRTRRACTTLSQVQVKAIPPTLFWNSKGHGFLSADRDAQPGPRVKAAQLPLDALLRIRTAALGPQRSD